MRHYQTLPLLGHSGSGVTRFMARILITSTNFRAHSDWGGLLRTAERLVEIGHEVLWASGPDVVNWVRHRGLKAVAVPLVDPYRGGVGSEPSSIALDRTVAYRAWRFALRGAESSRDDTGEMHRSYAFLIRLFADCWLQQKALDESTRATIVMAREWQPAVIIAEPMMWPGALAAEAIGVPLVGCGFPGAFLKLIPSDAIQSTVESIQSTMNSVRRGAGLPEENCGGVPELFIRSSHLQLVYFPDDWFGQLNAPPSSAPLYVGGDAQRLRRSPNSGERPLVVVATSTSYRPVASALRVVFEAVERVGADAVIGGGEAIRSCLSTLPPNVRVVSWVDYRKVLPKAAAMIHHGGMGTTHAAATAAVPQLICPGVGDQGLHADAVSDAGAGIRYVGPMTVNALVERLDALLNRRDYEKDAVSLAERLASFGGAHAAAKAVVALALETAG